MTRLAAVALVLASTVAVACSSSEARADEAAPSTAAGEIRELVRRMDEAHPDLYRSVSRADFQRAADELVGRLPGLSRDEAAVGVMKLVALAGARNGHTGVFPLGENAQPFRLYPIQLYRFADGLFVIGDIGGTGLVASRLVAIQGLPVAEVENVSGRPWRATTTGTSPRGCPSSSSPLRCCGASA